MSLADELYEANLPDSGLEYDELGLAIWDNVQYVVARALAVARRDRKDEYTVDQPHMRDDIIYFGNKPLKEDYANLVKLTKFTGRISPANQILFWEILKEHLPHLNRKIIQVSAHIFWDVDAGELKTRKEIENEIKRNQEIGQGRAKGSADQD